MFSLPQERHDGPVACFGFTCLVFFGSWGVISVDKTPSFEKRAAGLSRRPPYRLQRMIAGGFILYRRPAVNSRDFAFARDVATRDVPRAKPAGLFVGSRNVVDPIETGPTQSETDDFQLFAVCAGFAPPPLHPNDRHHGRAITKEDSDEPGMAQ